MRILDRLDELYAIGGGPGANRPHLSAAEDEAHRLVASWLEDAGLEVEVDRHGNLFGHAGRSARDTSVWSGSHLDTVPRGGRFDGALGVVAAIEAVERAGAGSVVVFRGEEVGCIGSRALVAAGGSLAEGLSRAPRRAGPEACRREMCRSGSSPGSSATRVASSSSRDAPGTRERRPMAGRDDALVAAAVRDPARARCGARHRGRRRDDREAGGRARRRQRHPVTRVG